MKVAAKILFIFLVLFAVTSTAFGQESNPDTHDEEFNLFLFSLLAIFLCVLLGAAVVGAVVATVVIFTVAALISFGIITSSIAIGLYKRFVAAGFKSFLILFFSIGCSLAGGIIMAIANYIFDFPMPQTVLLLFGIAGGLVGGILLAKASFSLFQALIHFLGNKLKLTQ